MKLFDKKTQGKQQKYQRIFFSNFLHSHMICEKGIINKRDAYVSY